MREMRDVKDMERLTARVQALEHECGDLQRRNDWLNKRIHEVVCNREDELLEAASQARKDQQDVMTGLLLEKANLNAKLMEQVATANAEVERLKMEMEGFRKANDLLMKGMESQCDLMDGMKQENRELKAEVERLRNELQSWIPEPTKAVKLPEEPPLAEAAKNCLEGSRTMTPEEWLKCETKRWGGSIADVAGMSEEEKAVLFGIGSSQPLGVMHCPTKTDLKEHE